MCIWSTVGVYLEYSWRVFGVQLGCIWRRVGVYLEYSWCVFGAQLVCKYIVGVQ